MNHQHVKRLRPKHTLEDKYWDLEVKIANIASNLGMSRAEMFAHAPTLAFQTRHEVALIVLAQRKLLKEIIRRKNTINNPARLVNFPNLNR